MYRADAVDMEAAAVAKGAEARGIRFSALKVISDSVDFDMPPTDRFVTSEGQFRSGRFVLFAALRPWVWGTVATLAKNSKAATRVLCRALEKELIERSSEVVPST
jgi:adenosylhomocysteine nucleosidase